MNNQNSHNDRQFMQIEWKAYILTLIKSAVMGAFLVSAFAFFYLKLKFVMILLFFVCMWLIFFMIVMLYQFLPNYTFYRRRLKQEEENYMAPNMREYGLPTLVYNMWFIWPRDLIEKPQKKHYK